MGIGIRQYTEKPRGTLCTRIVYGVGVSNILPLGLPPARLKGGKDGRVKKTSRKKMSNLQASRYKKKTMVL